MVETAQILPAEVGTAARVPARDARLDWIRRDSVDELGPSTDPMRSVVAKVRDVRASESHAANELDVEHNVTKRRRFHSAGAGGELCANDFATADLTDDVHGLIVAGERWDVHQVMPRIGPAPLANGFGASGRNRRRREAPLKRASQGSATLD